MKKLFCFGYGYVARALAAELDSVEWDVVGTSRRDVADFQFDQQHPLDPAVLQDVTHILVSIPPTEQGDVVLLQHRHDLQALPNLQWVGYLSSTGVYGDKKGDWVDEDSPCEPSGLVTQARYTAEQAWLTTDLPVHAFRLSGIYGPDRYMTGRVVSGDAQRIDKPGNYFSRIHVEDIAQVLIESMAAPNPGRIYNVCDNYPSPSREVLEFVCDKLGLEYPPLVKYENAVLSPMAKRFYKDSRRVRNDRIKNELGVKLKYPSFREGYAHLKP